MNHLAVDINIRVVFDASDTPGGADEDELEEAVSILVPLDALRSKLDLAGIAEKSVMSSRLADFKFSSDPANNDYSIDGTFRSRGEEWIPQTKPSSRTIKTVRVTHYESHFLLYLWKGFNVVITLAFYLAVIVRRQFFGHAKYSIHGIWDKCMAFYTSRTFHYFVTETSRGWEFSFVL